MVQKSPIASQPTAPLTARTERIILIEDDILIRKLFRILLDKSGFTNIIDIADGQDALDYLQHSPNPDLIVLDINLPRVSGLKIAQQIRQTTHHPKTKLFVVSAYPSVIFSHEADLADVVMMKPIMPQQIRSMIARLLPLRTPAGV